MGEEGGSAAEPKFEEELQNLERVVTVLERGELDLEDAIRQYESGRESLKRCYRILEEARKRIEVLVGPSSLPPPGPSPVSGTDPVAWKVTEIGSAQPSVS
jgi:exodeoxyribonuclease VII small subunit